MAYRQELHLEVDTSGLWSFQAICGSELYRYQAAAEEAFRVATTVMAALIVTAPLKLPRGRE